MRAVILSVLVLSALVFACGCGSSDSGDAATSGDGGSGGGGDGGGGGSDGGGGSCGPGTAQYACVMGSECEEYPSLPTEKVKDRQDGCSVSGGTWQTCPCSHNDVMGGCDYPIGSAGGNGAYEEVFWYLTVIGDLSGHQTHCTDKGGTWLNP